MNDDFRKLAMPNSLVTYQFGDHHHGMCNSVTCPFWYWHKVPTTNWFDRSQPSTVPLPCTHQALPKSLSIFFLHESSYQNGRPEVRPPFWRMKHRSHWPPFFMLRSPCLCGHHLSPIHGGLSQWLNVFLHSCLHICLGKPLPKLTLVTKGPFWLHKKETW